MGVLLALRFSLLDLTLRGVLSFQISSASEVLTIARAKSAIAKRTSTVAKLKADFPFIVEPGNRMAWIGREVRGTCAATLAVMLAKNTSDTCGASGREARNQKDKVEPTSPLPDYSRAKRRCETIHGISRRTSPD
jgi:hypothetical protein